MTAVLFALASAGCYGVSDFVGGITSRRSSPWTVAVYAQLVGGVLLGVLALGQPLRLSMAAAVWTVVAGLGNGIGTAALYRGFALGRMGVVAPLSGVGAAVLPVTFGVAVGERPGLLVWLGIVAALPGIWLVASEPPPAVDAPRPESAGVIDGLVAGAGFGLLFVALSQLPGDAGFLPLAANQLVAGVVVLAAAVALRAPLRPSAPVAWGGLVCGALGAGSTYTFMMATQAGELTIVSILASLYPALTVLLAAAVLRERVHGLQGVGMVLCAVAVGLVVGG